MLQVNLPWNPRYGSELRGGTHAILVHTRPLKDRNTRTLHTESNSRNSSSTSSRTSFSTIPNTGTKSENSTSSTGFGTRIRSAAGGALHRRLLPTRGRTVAINADYVYNSSFVDVNAYVETEDTVYLSFFHTRSIPTSPYYGNLNTYFMGAMTHCNRPPFQIHSMSSEPIVLDENEYRVAWFTNRINYVVYPTGAIYFWSPCPSYFLCASHLILVVIVSVFLPFIILHCIRINAKQEQPKQCDSVVLYARSGWPYRHTGSAQAPGQPHFCGKL